MRAVLALAAALAVILTGGSSAAQPSVWQRARDPELARAELLSDRLERLLDMRSQLEREPAVARDFALAAVAMADLAGAERLPGTRLQCVLGIALVDAGLYARAARVLERATRAAPAGSFGAHCHFSRAIAAAHLGDTELEVREYSRSLELAWDTQFQAQARCNRGEAWMRLGRLDRAVADLKTGVRLGSDPPQQALCYYALAVALDRSGDLPSAWEALDIALAIRLPLNLFASDDPLDHPGVFFVPAYEEHYFRGLASMARARNADGEGRKAGFELALAHFESYLAGAEAAADAWVTQARLHASRCRRELEQPPPATKR